MRNLSLSTFQLQTCGERQARYTTQCFSIINCSLLQDHATALQSAGHSTRQHCLLVRAGDWELVLSGSIPEFATNLLYDASHSISLCLTFSICKIRTIKLTCLCRALCNPPMKGALWAQSILFLLLSMPGPSVMEVGPEGCVLGS